MPDHGHPISPTCEPNGSGELKTQLLCPVTVIVDSQVSNRCPWATC